MKRRDHKRSASADDRHSHALSRNCRLIMSTVSRWLAHQDDLVRALHHTAVETIQMCTDAPIDAFLIGFEAEHPRLFKTYGRECIKDEAQAFLSLEFTELSVVFTALFEELNCHSFAGRLPSYRVKVMHDIPAVGSFAKCLEQQVSIEQREIAIQYNGWPEDMVRWLTTFMEYVRI